MSQRPGNPNSGTTGNNTQDPRVIDFTEVRAQRLEEKRRKTERILFKQLLSVYSVVGDARMCPIELVDVSEDGCSFQVPYDPEKPWPKDMTEIPIRLYFSQDTFLEIRVQIQNSRDSIENHSRYVRYGCAVDRLASTFPAYQQFVRFLHMYAEFARKDNGDLTVFYL